METIDAKEVLLLQSCNYFCVLQNRSIEKHLLILSYEKDNLTRISERTAHKRNEWVVSLSDEMKLYSLIAFTSTPWAHRAGHFPSMTGQHTSRAISASLSIQRPSTHCISFYSYLIWAIFSPQEYTFSMIHIEKKHTFSMIHALSSPEKGTVEPEHLT